MSEIADPVGKTSPLYLRVGIPIGDMHAPELGTGFAIRLGSEVRALSSDMARLWMLVGTHPQLNELSVAMTREAEVVGDTLETMERALGNLVETGLVTTVPTEFGSRHEELARSHRLVPVGVSLGSAVDDRSAFRFSIPGRTDPLVVSVALYSILQCCDGVTSVETAVQIVAKPLEIDASAVLQEIVAAIPRLTTAPLAFLDHLPSPGVLSL